MLETIGSRVRAARLRAGLTQRVLAAQAGCSQQTIVDIELGSTRSKFLPHIARVLDEPLDHFLKGSGSSVVTATRLPHFDLYELANDVPVPLDRIFGPPVEDMPARFTVAVDKITAQRSGGALLPGDVLYCEPPARAPDESCTVVAFCGGWQRAEVCRIEVIDDATFLGAWFSAPPETPWQRVLLTTCRKHVCGPSHWAPVQTALVVAVVTGLFRKF